MKVYMNRMFRSKHDRNSGRTFSDFEFRECRFESCWISFTRHPHRRSTVRNVRLIDCEETGSTLYSAIVEDVLVDGFKTHSPFQCWGAVFKHVTIRGKIGRVMTSPLILTAVAEPEEQRAFDLANETYYSTVDWALDISEARFLEADLRGIPARLIRRDPETQFIIRRERVLQISSKAREAGGDYWVKAIQLFLDLDLPDKVIVAPKQHPRFRRILGELYALRDAGVLEAG
jgi:hypothetical protein